MEEKTQGEFTGIWIPKEICIIPNLSWTEKILLVEILSLTGEGGCYASNKYLADFLGVSGWTVSSAISKLKRLGFIDIIDAAGKNRLIKPKANPEKSEKQPWENPKVIKTTLGKSKGILGKIQRYPWENPKQNNIINNIYNNNNNITTTGETKKIDLNSYNIYEILRNKNPQDILSAIKEQIVPNLGAFLYCGPPPTDETLIQYITKRHKQNWLDRGDVPVRNIGSDLADWLKREQMQKTAEPKNKSGGRGII